MPRNHRIRPETYQDEERGVTLVRCARCHVPIHVEDGAWHHDPDCAASGWHREEHPDGR